MSPQRGGDAKAEPEGKHRGYGPLCQPPHTAARHAPLSVAAENTEYRGLFHLSIMVLIAVNVRLVVENIMRYGVLIGLPSGNIDFAGNWRCALCVLQIWLHLAAAWGLERFLPRIPLAAADLLHLLNAAALFGSCWAVVAEAGAAVGVGVVVLCTAITFTLKLLSFWHAARTLRAALAAARSDDQRRAALSDVLPPEDAAAMELAAKYPRSLPLGHVLRFGFYPTLVFQLSYPRTPRVVKRHVLRYLVEVVFCTALIMAIIEQYIRPLLFNAKAQVDVAWQQGQYGLIGALMVERLLKLVVPNLYVWLVLFVGLFHSWLNLLAEVTCFADRLFYSDWWNARSFREYWQKWNLPVRDWFRAHLYLPLRRKGVSQEIGTLLIFLISGVLHEFVTVVPLKMGVQVLVTISFVAQLPLFILTDTRFFKARPVLGNCFFWFVFCVAGQPVAVLVYFFLALNQK